MNLADLLRRPDWHKDAACRGMPVSWFYPARGEDTSQAMAVCRGCPVAGPCGEAGKAEHFGIWSGLAERGRRNLREGRELAPIRHGTPGGWISHRRRHEAPCLACEAARERERADKAGAA